MRRLLSAVSFVLMLVPRGASVAEDAKAAKAKPDQEIRKLLTEMEECFNRRDAKGLAACWTANGDFVSQEGERFVGRDSIEKGFQASFGAKKESKLQILVLSTRLVGEGVALIDAVVAVKPQTTVSAGEPTFQLVLAKHEGRWLIETARETVNQVSGEVPQLKELGWMVGSWAEENTRKSGVTVRSTCDWATGGNWLIRKFSATGKKGLVRGGTEVIGWDARAHRIRSWVFDYDGSFGENVWVRDGNRWVVKHAGTLADGGDASVKYIVTPVDADTITVRSKDHVVNGEKQPDLPEITMKRQAAQPSKAPQHVLP
jgi:uncharacterized protein (TIGR02246 family)